MQKSLFPTMGCSVSRHGDICWHTREGNKSVSPTRHDTMIMSIMMLRKNKGCHLGQGQTIGPSEARGSGQAATTGD